MTTECEAVNATAAGATWSDAVNAFKRRLLATTLAEAGGNRTHAARRLGLQRTYLLRLIRQFEVGIPPAPRRPAPSPWFQ